MQPRTHLRYETFTDLIVDLNKLSNGYTQTGNWDLAQCAGHLCQWMSFPMQGYPRVPWLLKKLVFPMMRSGYRKQYLGLIPVKKGGPTMKETVPPPGGDESGAVSELMVWIERLQHHTGPWYDSPVLGKLSREEVFQAQLTHCAHHLSFLVPKSE